MSSCVHATRAALSIIKALVSRTLFLLHGLLCIWRVTVVKRRPEYWALAATVPLLAGETVYTLCRKKGREWKWWVAVPPEAI